MSTLGTRFERLDIRITRFLATYGLLLMRVSLGIVFFWFGMLKFFPGYSPSQALAIQTMQTLTFGLLTPHLCLLILATWECFIGIGLIIGRWMRRTLFLLFVQLLGTMSPIFLFPEAVFVTPPFVLTMFGHYIILNLVLISAGLVLGATVRGGHIVTNDMVKYNVLCFYPSGRADYGISMYSSPEDDAATWTHRWPGSAIPE